MLCLSVSISFENYRKVHPYEDSDSSEDEVDWQDTRHDPYKAGNWKLNLICIITFHPLLKSSVFSFVFIFIVCLLFLL